MGAYRVARRYAEAASELAEEQHLSEQVALDLDMVRNTLKNSRELVAFLKSPVISKEKKNSVLSDLFRTKVTSFTFSFLALLLEKGREDVLVPIIDQFFKMQDDRLGITELEIQSASELTGDQQKAIVKRFETITGKTVRVTQTVDKELIGGFIARVDDTVYDGSVQRQLELLRARFAGDAGSN
jgi:F-type H+-transporting ATPase subunit delta